MKGALPIAQALRWLRERKGVKQVDVTRAGGPDHRTISHWEKGRKAPSLQGLNQFLTALALDFYDLQDALNRVAGRPVGIQHQLAKLEERVSALETAIGKLPT